MTTDMVNSTCRNLTLSKVQTKIYAWRYKFCNFIINKNSKLSKCSNIRKIIAHLYITEKDRYI